MPNLQSRLKPNNSKLKSAVVTGALVAAAGFTGWYAAEKKLPKMLRPAAWFLTAAAIGGAAYFGLSQEQRDELKRARNTPEGNPDERHTVSNHLSDLYNSINEK